MNLLHIAAIEFDYSIYQEVTSNRLQESLGEEFQSIAINLNQIVSIHTLPKPMGEYGHVIHFSNSTSLAVDGNMHRYILKFCGSEG